MRKRFLFLVSVLALALLFLTPQVRAADVPDDISVYGPGENPLSRLAGNMLSYLAYGIYNFPGFFTVDELVFLEGENAPEVGGVFSEEEWEGVMRWFLRVRFVALSGSLVTLVFVLLALRHVASSSNARARAESMESFLNVLVALGMVLLAVPLCLIVMQANEFGIGVVKEWIGTEGLSWFKANASRGALDAIAVEGNTFLSGIARLVFAVVCLHLNFLYLVRKVVMAVCIMAFPLAAWSWATKKTRLPVFLLGSEIATNAVMGLSHAAVLGMIYELFFSKTASITGSLPVSLAGVSMFETWWARIFVFTLLAPTSALLRRVVAGWLNFLGIDEEKWAAGASLGLSGLFTVGSALAAVGGAGLTAAGGVMGSMASAMAAAPVAAAPGRIDPRLAGTPVGPRDSYPTAPAWDIRRLGSPVGFGPGPKLHIPKGNGPFSKAEPGSAVTGDFFLPDRFPKVRAEVFDGVAHSFEGRFGNEAFTGDTFFAEPPAMSAGEREDLDRALAGGPVLVSGEKGSFVVMPLEGTKPAAPGPGRGKPKDGSGGNVQKSPPLNARVTGPSAPVGSASVQPYGSSAPLRPPFPPGEAWRAFEEASGAVGRALGAVAGMGVPGMSASFGHAGEAVFAMPVRGLRSLFYGASAVVRAGRALRAAETPKALDMPRWPAA